MKYLLLILALAGVAPAFAQSRQLWLEQADEHFAQRDYYDALVYYRKAIDDSLSRNAATFPYEVDIATLPLRGTAEDSVNAPIDAYVQHRIAQCYLFTADYKQAVKELHTSAASGYYPDDHYYLGRAEMTVGDYQAAIGSFETYIQLPENNDSLSQQALQSMTGCHYALQQDYKPTLTVSKMDSTFNNGSASFAPMFFDREKRMLFTSAREGGVVLDPERQQSEYLCDLYWTERAGDGWSAPTNFGRPLNSAQHDASGAFNNGNALFFTRWSDENPSIQHIFIGRMIDYLFFESYKLDSSVNVPGYRSINPFVSLDGTQLYFSSNRPGGMGGMDIWTIALDENGNPKGEATNLGAPVNTESDEVTPFFHETSSTLYFSSDGHASIGGLDIFKSTYDRDTKRYAIPANMGQPVNSSKDDSYMIWDRYMRYGYFSSDREDCPSHHCYDIYEVAAKPIRITLDGHVYNANTNEPIPDAVLTFKDIRSVFDPFTKIADTNAYYATELHQFWEVFVRAQHKGFFADAYSIDTRKLTEDTHLVQDFYLRPIPLGEIVIEGIEYDFDSDKLRPESKQVLDKLAEFLALNENLVVEMNAHTDHVGPDIYNLDLSQRRARSCVEYLISKGIAKDRLIPIGHGEGVPATIEENGTEVVLTEQYILSQPESRFASLTQRNRRTTFKVIGEAYITP